MAKGSGHVTITGNDLIFNCVLSGDQSEHFQLTSTSSTGATTSATGEGPSTGTVINRRKICTSSAYKSSTNCDSSDTRGEMEHILCDSNDNEHSVDNGGNFVQGKGNHRLFPLSPSSSLREKLIFVNLFTRVSRTRNCLSQLFRCPNGGAEEYSLCVTYTHTK